MPRKAADSMQFSVRSLFAATTCIGVLLAVLVPIMRRLEPETARQAWMVIGGLSLLSLVWFVLLCGYRWHSESRGGPLLRRVQPPLRFAPIAQNVGMLIVLLAVFAGTAYAAMPVALGPESAFALIDKPYLGLLLTTATLAVPQLWLVYIVTLLWWRTSPMAFEARENGVRFGAMRFVPWKSITSYHWTDGTHGIILTLIVHSQKRIAVMSKAEKQPVQELLDQKEIVPATS